MSGRSLGHKPPQSTVVSALDPARNSMEKAIQKMLQSMSKVERISKTYIFITESIIQGYVPSSA